MKIEISDINSLIGECASQSIRAKKGTAQAGYWHGRLEAYMHILTMLDPKYLGESRQDFLAELENPLIKKRSLAHLIRVKLKVHRGRYYVN